MKVLTVIKNNKFLSFVIIVYTLLGIAIPNNAIESIGNSIYYIKEMVIIMPVILLLTSLIEAWVPKKTIEDTLGENAGFKGYIFSFLLGSFSAGPIYAAFPICKTLLKKGARISNIVIILSSWAVIKIPMLANEAKFLGVKFTLIRWILTTISIFSMAYIMNRLVKNEDIIVSQINSLEKETKDHTMLSVNKDYCIGCGICSKLAPNNFKIENKKAIVKSNNIRFEDYEDIKYIIDKCPAKAIKFKDDYKSKNL